MKHKSIWYGLSKHGGGSHQNFNIVSHIATLARMSLVVVWLRKTPIQYLVIGYLFFSLRARVLVWMVLESQLTVCLL